MSIVTASPSTAAPTVAARTAVAVAGVVGAIGAAGYISTIFLLSDLTVRDAARSPLTITSNLLVAIGFAVLAATLPSLTASIRLPRWPAVVGAVGCAFVAANAWGTATLAVHAAGVLTEEQMEQTSAWFTLFQAPQTIPCAIGFIGIAVAGWRRQVMSRGPCILLLVAGLVNLLPAYPPGALVAGLALAWAARSARPGPGSLNGNQGMQSTPASPLTT